MLEIQDVSRAIRFLEHHTLQSYYRLISMMRSIQTRERYQNTPVTFLKVPNSNYLILPS